MAFLWEKITQDPLLSYKALQNMPPPSCGDEKKGQRT